MLNIIWIAFFVSAFLMALYRALILGDGGVWTELVNSVFVSSKAAFSIALNLTGILCFWAKAGVPYLAKALDIAKKYFSNLKIEVMPLKAEEYAELKEHGLNGVICFQETYNKARYNIYHPRGMKSKFEWRVNGFDRMGASVRH